MKNNMLPLNENYIQRIKSKYNDEQQEAIFVDKVSALVSAGAGSGKTHHNGALCIHIIASCIHQHMPGAGKWFLVLPVWTAVCLEEHGDSSKM